MGGMSGEREPKGATASDTSGERHEGGKEHPAKGMSGEREPAGAKSSDTTGEKRVRVHAGIGMGKADATGREADHGKFEGHVGQHNTGRGSSTSHFHKHQRAPGSTYK